jgi:hypothetical protein
MTTMAGITKAEDSLEVQAIPAAQAEMGAPGKADKGPVVGLGEEASYLPELQML